MSDARAAPPLIEPDGPTDIMALRRYCDRSGCDWNVWSVQPPPSELVQEPLREGWLCFQRTDGGDRYRLPLSEAPSTWEALPAERLDLLCRVAALSPSTGPMRRVSSPEQQPDDAVLVSPAPSA